MRAMGLEGELAASRLEALRMQLHPHFLFNTLHAIAGLTVEDPATAHRMVIVLGDLLRRTLKNTDERVRTLGEESEYSDLYLGNRKNCGSAIVCRSTTIWISKWRGLVGSERSIRSLVFLTWFATDRFHPVHGIRKVADPIWAALFDGKRNTYIVPADIGFDLLEDMSHSR